MSPAASEEIMFEKRANKRNDSQQASATAKALQMKFAAAIEMSVIILTKMQKIQSYVSNCNYYDCLTTPIFRVAVEYKNSLSIKGLSNHLSPIPLLFPTLIVSVAPPLQSCF